MTLTQIQRAAEKSLMCLLVMKPCEQRFCPSLRSACQNLITRAGMGWVGVGGCGCFEPSPFFLSLRKRAAALPFHSFALLRLSPVNQPVLSAPLFSISKAAAADAHGNFGSSGAGLCAQVLSVWHFSTVIRPRPQLFFWKILNRK